MKPKVIILTAGPGSRLGTYTKYFNKGLLKIGDKACISHIIEYFPKDYDFIVVVGHLKDIVIQYIKISHPDIKVTFVEQDNNTRGPGDAFNQCVHLIDGPFYLWCSDCLIKGPLPSEENDWIGYSNVPSEDEEYSSIEIKENEHDNNVINFYEKGENYTGNAYIGACFIKNYLTFLQGMEEQPVTIKNQLQISAGFRWMLECSCGENIKAMHFNWYDIGDLDKLYETRKKFDSKIENLDKIDEEIYFFEDKVVKYFYNEKDCQNRVKKAKILKGYVPEIIESSNNFYAYKYTEGVDLFDKSQNKNLSRNILNLLEGLWKSTLWEEKRLNPEEYLRFQQSCVDFYYKKL